MNMGIVLQDREYQNLAVGHSLEFLMQKKKRNGIVIVPCGGGKSLIAARIILGLDAPAILLQPRKELLIQNRDKMRLYGFDPGIFSASMKKREVGSDITLATIKSIIQYSDHFQDVRYVLIDECSEVNAKEGQYRDFFNALHPDCRFLGLDATPFRLTSDAFGSQMKFLTRTKPRIFDDVVYWVQLQELLEQGYLAPLEYFSLHREIDFDSGLELNSQGSDYTDQSVQLHLFKVGFESKLAEVTRRLLAKDRKGILIFTRFTKEAEALAAELPEVEVVSTNTSDGERDRILSQFKDGEVRAVANVGITGIGLDHPAADTVVLARHTWSLRIVYQQIGRIVRPAPGKKSGWVVDMVGNLKTFGKLEHLKLYCEGDRRWEFWGRPDGGPEKQLTNCYIAGGIKGLCPKCRTPKLMAYYPVKQKWLPVSRAPYGRKGNVTVEQNGSKKICQIVGRGEGDWVLHFAYCSIFQKMRETQT